jgi:hypothetical protein
MTEAEWLSCQDPQPMLNALSPGASGRKLRLFACACCRRVWHLLGDERSRTAVEVAERYADALATEEDLAEAGDAAEAAARRARGRVRIAVSRAARDAVGDAAAVGAVADGAAWAAATAAGYGSPWGEITDAPWLARLREHAALLRDIFGSPFRAPTAEPSWLAWNDHCVERIAEVIYEERRLQEGTLDPARLAVLADALLDAGCDDEDLIQHCRSDGPHVRGCWAVDLLLAKQ